MWDTRKPHFLVGFNPSINSVTLKIPSKFITHMEGRANGTTYLVGPSGNSWPADLVQQDDCLFFQNGWASFVKDHCLKSGDSLVFRYDGDLHFSVQAFDESSCEKEAAFYADFSQGATNLYNPASRKRDRGISSSLECIVEGVPKKMRSTPEDANTVTIAVPSQGEIILYNPEVKTGNSNFGKDMCLSAQEAEKVARSFTSSFPSFTKVMKRFNIGGSYTLNIPYQFATEHLPKCKVKILLHNLKGKTWTVNSIPTTRVEKTSHTFCGGWLSFVRDNNIDLGDICIFELVHECELRVRVLRVEKEGTDYAATSAEISERKVGSNSNSCLPLLAKAKISNGDSVIRKPTSCPDKQGSFTKSCMSMRSAPEEKLAAESFFSNFPHFVRIMKKFNISGSYTLKVPYQFSMEHLPSCRTEIVLRNLKGKCWTVNSIPTVKVQMLHTFCGGWSSFVRDNDIQMGDICIFELVGKYEMRVHICAIGKKGLDYQNGVTSNESAILASLTR